MLTLTLDFDCERFCLTGDYEDDEGDIVVVGESGPFKHLRQGVKFYLEQGVEILVYHVKNDVCQCVGIGALPL